MQGLLLFIGIVLVIAWLGRNRPGPGGQGRRHRGGRRHCLWN